MDFDVTPEPLFRAVGRAMSSWERLEAHLSYLYSILVKKPMQIEALQAYGRDQRIFDLRMKALKKAADGYEILSPSQERESLLDSLIGEARQLSTYRNQIAHGVVTPVQMPPLNMPLEPWPEPTWIYVLMPSWYGVFHLTKTTGYYQYGSKQVDEFTSKFHSLAEGVREFIEKLRMPRTL